MVDSRIPCLVGVKWTERPPSGSTSRAASVTETSCTLIRSAGASCVAEGVPLVRYPALDAARCWGWGSVIDRFSSFRGKGIEGWWRQA